MVVFPLVPVTPTTLKIGWRAPNHAEAISPNLPEFDQYEQQPLLDEGAGAFAKTNGNSRSPVQSSLQYKQVTINMALPLIATNRRPPSFAVIKLHSTR